jgi:hypothetical protein
MSEMDTADSSCQRCKEGCFILKAHSTGLHLPSGVVERGIRSTLSRGLLLASERLRLNASTARIEDLDDLFWELSPPPFYPFYLPTTISHCSSVVPLHLQHNWRFLRLPPPSTHPRNVLTTYRELHSHQLSRYMQPELPPIHLPLCTTPPHTHK